MFIATWYKMISALPHESRQTGNRIISVVFQKLHLLIHSFNGSPVVRSADRLGFKGSLDLGVLLSVKNALILTFLCHTEDLKQKRLNFFIHSALHSC